MAPAVPGTLAARGRRRALLGDVAGAALLVVALWLLLPVRLGGSASFVVVQGDSMVPHFHSGDLVYARRADHASVGDVVIYRMPIGDGSTRLVVHRIVEVRDDGSLVVRGDNRTTPDAVNPTTDELVGAPVVNLAPWGTRAVVLVPFALTLALGVLVVWWCWPTEAQVAAATVGEAADEVETGPEPTALATRTGRSRPSEDTTRHAMGCWHAVDPDKLRTTQRGVPAAPPSGTLRRGGPPPGSQVPCPAEATSVSS